MTSKRILLDLTNKVIAERIEDRKEKIRLMKKHKITVVSRDECLRVFLGDTLILSCYSFLNGREDYIRNSISMILTALEAKETIEMENKKGMEITAV